MRGGFVHAEFWDGMAACHDFSLMQEMGTGKYPSTYIILYLPFYLSIYDHLSVPMMQLLHANCAGVCIMGYTFKRVSMCSWVILGGL